MLLNILLITLQVYLIAQLVRLIRETYDRD